MHYLIISAGQNVLKKETIIKGFQHPCLGQRCAFNVQHGDFIQVLNNASCHWLTISTIGASCGEVFVYHSLYSGAGSSLKDQISSILHTNGKVEYPHVQQQSGLCDCGLLTLSAHAREGYSSLSICLSVFFFIVEKAPFSGLKLTSVHSR